MYNVELFFKKARPNVVETDVKYEIDWLLQCLARNGQMIDEYSGLSIVRGGYKTIVSLPEPGSLRPSLHNKWVRAALRRLLKTGVNPPSQRLIGWELESAPPCKCRKRSALVLESETFNGEPPVRCGDCLGIVPFYRFRHTDDDSGNFEDIVFWARWYECLVRLWLHSRAGERFAYRALSRHDSDLSTTGREICRRIEERTGTPTYYYLFRWNARSVVEERRRLCPGCRRKWLLKEPWHDTFHFRCDRCRLISEFGQRLNVS